MKLLVGVVRHNPTVTDVDLTATDLESEAAKDLAALSLGCERYVNLNTLGAGFPGETLQSIEVPILRSGGWSATLEFEMHLMSRMDHRHVLRCVGTATPGQGPHRQFMALQVIREGG